MCRLDFVIAIVLVPCYMISTVRMHPASDESSQSHFQNYDSQSSDEFFDPMKQTYKTFEDFVSAGTRPDPVLQMLKASTQPIRYADGGDEETTIGAVTTDKPDEMTTIDTNDAAGHGDEPSPLPLVDTSNASDLSSLKQAKMIVTQPVEHAEHLAQLHAENDDEELAAVAMYSRNDTDDDGSLDTEDIDGDDSIGTLVSQQQLEEATLSPYAPITTTDATYPYAVPSTAINGPQQTTTVTVATTPIINTTLAPLPTTIPTAAVPMTISTTTKTTTTTTPTTTTAAIITSSKKSKKIETPTRFFKYSADEILRKYLEDIHIRSPLAVLINTSPVPLRKAKQLWKATLRPNSPTDCVLVAFNSSGER